MIAYSPGQRVVPINFAYGYYKEAKTCAGTVLRLLGDALDHAEVAWDDGDTEAEYIGDLVHLGAHTSSIDH